MAVGQNQLYHFGVGAPSLVYLTGDSDVDWGYGILTHGHISCFALATGDSPKRSFWPRSRAQLCG